MICLGIQWPLNNGLAEFITWDEKDVFVYNLASIEYYILDLLDRKIDLFELVVSEVIPILGDIEEKEDFSDLVMNTSSNAETNEEVQSELEQNWSNPS